MSQTITHKPLAATPPMGWNSWNSFGSKVTGEAVCQVADVLVASGLKDCGYEYIVIDDCWSLKDRRDANGDLTPNPERFPDGIKPVADYVHSLGFKFGIYSDAGEMTCASYPGSNGFEEQDARLWAGWGVDFLKYDYCFAPPDQATAIERYTRMGTALKNCGREILFSICEWGGRSPHLWARQAGGHMWRSTGDVIDSWVDVQAGSWWGLGIDAVPDIAAGIAEYAGPGGWNDMDMLVVGLSGSSEQIPGKGASLIEYHTHMSLWSMVCSPLMIGCDVRRMTPEVAEIFMNREVLAVNQDPLGTAARRIRKTGGLELWRKPLADGSLALALLNRGSNRAEIPFRAGEIGLLDGHKAVIRDLWKKEDIGEFKAENAYEVGPHATLLLKVSA